MAKSVLIFDEVQSTPINCVHLLCQALNFLTTVAGSTAVLCTATQPGLNDLKHSALFGRLQLAPQHEIVREPARFFKTLKRVEAKDLSGNPMTANQLASFALDVIAEHRTTLVIVNTKKVANEVFTALESEFSDDELFYLTTNLCPAHRQKQLERIRNRLADSSLRTLVVSTALIEAGVDISFASVVRSLSGLDSIAQAAGRCNRNGELAPKLGMVYLVDCSSERLDSLREINRCKVIAKEKLGHGAGSDPLSLEMIEKYFKAYRHHEENATLMTYPAFVEHQKTSMMVLLGVNAAAEPKFDLNISRSKQLPLLQQAFKTASKHFRVIDDITIPVIVEYEEGKELVETLNGATVEFDAKQFFQALRKSQRYSVNLYEQNFNRLFELGAIHRIGEQHERGIELYTLSEEFYSERLGVTDRLGRIDTLNL